MRRHLVLPCLAGVLLLSLSAPAEAVPVACEGFCTVSVGGSSITVQASDESLDVASWIVDGVSHLYLQNINLFDADTGEAVDVVLLSATQDAVMGQIVVRYREEFDGAVEGTATFTLSENGNTSILQENLSIRSFQNGVRGQLYVFTDFDLEGGEHDASANVSAGTLTQTDGATTATVGVISGPPADAFELDFCCDLEDIVFDVPVALNGTSSLGAGDVQFAQSWTRTLNSGQVFEVTLRKTVGPPAPDRAAFDALGGYQAYLAEPSNADLLAAGVCDDDSAFAHWRDVGYAEGRLFAGGALRSDLPGAAPDPDYAIDGGFSWDYEAYLGMKNTVVFITADAPKPPGWDGRDLLLEGCQQFNLGPFYTAQDYRTINTDVALAIDGGLIPGFDSVTDHYVKYGFKEGRLTNAGWTQAQQNAWNDAAYYAVNPDVEAYFLGAQSEGWVLFGKAGFAHWINFGQFEGRNPGQTTQATQSQRLDAALEPGRYSTVRIPDGPPGEGVMQVSGPLVTGLQYSNGALTFVSPVDSGEDFTLAFVLEDQPQIRYELEFESRQPSLQRSLQEPGDPDAEPSSPVDPNFAIRVSGPDGNVITSSLSHLTLSIDYDGSLANLTGGSFSILLDTNEEFRDLTDRFTLNATGNALVLKPSVASTFVDELGVGSQELEIHGADAAGRYYSFAIQLLAGTNTLSGQLVDETGAPLDAPAAGLISIVGLVSGYSRLVSPEPDGSFGATGLPTESFEVRFVDPSGTHSGVALLAFTTSAQTLNLDLTLISSASGSAIPSTAAVAEAKALVGPIPERSPAREVPLLRSQGVAGETSFGSVTAIGAGENVTISDVFDVTIPQGTESLEIAVEVTTAEYPVYTTEPGNRYNDSWRYEWSCGGHSGSRSDRVNISHAATGERRYDQVIDVSTSTATSSISCRIQAYTTNIGDGALPTSVTVDVRGAPPANIVSVRHLSGLFKDHLQTYHMGLPIGSGAPGIRRPFKIGVQYEPADAEVTAVGGRILLSGQEATITNNMTFEPIADGRIEITVRFANPLALSSPFQNQLASLFVDLTVYLDESPYQTEEAPLTFGTEKDVFMPIFETRNLATLPAARRYNSPSADPREDQRGGDGWGRIDTLSWLHATDLRFNDVSGEHAWQTNGLALGSHHEHKGGYDVDARYVDDTGASANTMRGDGNGIQIKSVLDAAQNEVATNAPSKPNLSRIVNWIQANRVWLNGIAGHPNVIRLYVGIAAWHRDALIRGRFPNGTLIPTVSGAPGFVGAWTNKNAIIVPKPGNHEGHIHVRFRP